MTGAAAEDGSRAAYYPVYLDLSGRRVVIVGGGAVAAAKVPLLLEAGARLTVIAPTVDEAIRRAADGAELTWTARDYHPGDLHGVRVAIDATENREANNLLREEAEREGCLLNSVDRPPLCDWIAPALVNRGPLKIAVSTAGESPFVAAAVRRRLELLFGPEWKPFVRMVGALRRRLRADGRGAREQESIYRAALRSDALALLREGRGGEAEHLLDSLRSGPGSGRVTIVDAGPGPLEHLTQAAREAIHEADAVFYEAADAPAALALCGPRTHRVPAPEDLAAALVRAAGSDGEDVVCLLSENARDPGIALLRQHGVEVRALPGAPSITFRRRR